MKSENENKNEKEKVSAKTCSEFETIEIDISKNVQHFQRLDATNMKYIKKNIKPTDDSKKKSFVEIKSIWSS